MPLYTGDAAKLIVAGINGKVHAAYRKKSQADIMGPIAMSVGTTLPTVPYPWLGQVPTMREWVGPRQKKSMKSYDFSISDKRYEASMGIERKLIEDAQFDFSSPRIADFATEVVSNIAIRTLIQQVYCANPTGYDGTTLWSTTHPESGSNQSNRTSSALSEQAVIDGIAAMGQFVDDTGEPFGVSPTVLFVGPKNDNVADRILNSTMTVVTQMLASGGPTLSGSANVLQGRLQKVVSPYLTGAYDDYWFLIDTTREVRPAIYQYRTDITPEVVVKAAPDDDNVIDLDEIAVYGRRRFGVGPGAWWTGYAGIL
jgi:phage major head subunit gpT-like protein